MHTFTKYCQQLQFSVSNIEWYSIISTYKILTTCQCSVTQFKQGLEGWVLSLVTVVEVHSWACYCLLMPTLAIHVLKGLLCENWPFTCLTMPMLCQITKIISCLCSFFGLGPWSQVYWAPLRVERVSQGLFILMWVNKQCDQMTWVMKTWCLY